MEKVLLLERPTELTPEALQDALATRAKQVEVAEELSVEYAGFAAVLNYEDKAPGTPEGKETLMSVVGVGSPTMTVVPLLCEQGVGVLRHPSMMNCGNWRKSSGCWKKSWQR